MAPTCNVCLIRDDLTSLWCEVTSSIRTRSIEDEGDSSEALSTDETETVKGNAGQPGPDGKAASQSNAESEEAPVEQKVPQTVELLLCLRPIRDGGKVDESMRFNPRKRMRPAWKSSLSPMAGITTSGIGASGVAEIAISLNSNGDPSDQMTNAHSAEMSGSPRKRHAALPTAEHRESAKRRRKDKPSSSSETEKSVVESLILMSHKPH
jgi:hypothetical protein